MKAKSVLRTAIPIISTFVIAVALIGGGTLPAYATGSYPTLAASNIRSGAGTNFSTLRGVAQGSYLSIDCFVNGEKISGTTIWDHVVGGGFISDALLKTGSDSAVVPACSSNQSAPAAPAARYNRTSATAWALEHSQGPNKFVGDDCTFYASQVLWIGGLPRTSVWTDWSSDKALLSSSHFMNPGPTKNSSVAYMLVQYLLDNHLATEQKLDLRQNNVPQAQLGDIIAYEWGGTSPINHLMVVTGFSGQYPLVSGHSNDVTNQGWTYSNAEKNWIQVKHPKAVAFLIHITY